MKIISFVSCFLILILFSCGGKSAEQPPTNPERPALPKQTESRFAADKDSILQSLEEIADIERAGSWGQGMALTESGLRENIGDYAGAVAAVYKELAYAYGMGLIKKEDIELCLLNILDARNEEEVIAAVNAVLAFTRGQWAQASNALKQLFGNSEEPDGFENWMILVCALENTLERARAQKNEYEKNSEDRRSDAAYKAIRARYAQFPEYWYRGAKIFSGAVSAEYAENCINISPEGPFTGECRKILAVHTGLKTEDSPSIRTKQEIETAVSRSINANNPELLEPLLPLIGLPDNPYTIYAVGALRALTSAQNFRDYFNRQALASRGRLAERLLYISRG